MGADFLSHTSRKSSEIFSANIVAFCLALVSEMEEILSIPGSQFSELGRNPRGRNASFFSFIMEVALSVHSSV